MTDYTIERTFQDGQKIYRLWRMDSPTRGKIIHGPACFPDWMPCGGFTASDDASALLIYVDKLNYTRRAEG